MDDSLESEDVVETVHAAPPANADEKSAALFEADGSNQQREEGDEEGKRTREDILQVAAKQQ